MIPDRSARVIVVEQRLSTEMPSDVSIDDNT